MKYRRKPQVIEAWQYKGDPGTRGVCHCNDQMGPHLHTIHGGNGVPLATGDWITPEADGEHYYPIDPEYFAANFEPVEQT